MKCALYHRVSTTDQDPALARDDLRAAARQRGFEIMMEIEETGSGARNDRPGLRKVMDAAMKGKVQGVLVWKLDRFGRSALDLLSNIRALQGAGVRFISTTQGIDLRPEGDVMGQLMITVLSGVAEFERSIIVERTKAGIEKARKAGKHLGRPRSQSAPSSGRVEDLRERGFSWAKIGKELGCTPSAAQRALTRKGSAEIAPLTSRNLSTSPACS